MGTAESAFTETSTPTPAEMTFFNIVQGLRFTEFPDILQAAKENTNTP